MITISGQNASCIEERLACNCNSHAPQILNDLGMITNMSLLPIMGFAYGPLQYDMSSLNVTIGPLVCSGLKNIEESLTHPRIKSKFNEVESQLEIYNNNSKQTDELIGYEFHSMKQSITVSQIEIQSE